VKRPTKETLTVATRAARKPKVSQQSSDDGLRQSIIEAARQAFAEESYQGLTMRKIAARVGCTAGAIYVYFPSREELLRRVWAVEFEKVHVYNLGAVDQAKCPVEKVRQIFLSWVRYFLQHQDDFRIMFGWTISSAGSDKIKTRSGPNESYDYFKKYLGDVIKDAPHAPENLDMAMQCLLTASFGIVAMANSPSQFPWFDPVELASLSIDSILTGWGVEAKKPD
jgi:AcrR family transcriptional regulator